MPTDFQRVTGRMEADVQCAWHTINVMLTNAGRGRIMRAEVGQPEYRRLPPSPPSPYRNTGWDRMAWPLLARHPEHDHSDD